MTTPCSAPRATPKEIIAYFSTDARPVKLPEISNFKKADPDGYGRIAEGLADGTLTY